MSNTATEQLVVKFGPVKQEIKRTLQELQAVQQTREVQDAIATLQRTMDELNNKCQPTMEIPVTPR